MPPTAATAGPKPRTRTSSTCAPGALLDEIKHLQTFKMSPARIAQILHVQLSTVRSYLSAINGADA